MTHGTGLPTIAQALAGARAMGLDRLDAHWLLGHALQQSSTWLIAHDDQPLTEAEISRENPPNALTGALVGATPEVHKSEGGMSIKVTRLAEGLSHPNGLVFLPDGHTMLLTERAGRLRKVTDGVLDPTPVAERRPAFRFGPGPRPKARWNRGRGGPSSRCHRGPRPRLHAAALDGVVARRPVGGAGGPRAPAAAAAARALRRRRAAASGAAGVSVAVPLIGLVAEGNGTTGLAFAPSAAGP